MSNIVYMTVKIHDVDPQEFKETIKHLDVDIIEEVPSSDEDIAEIGEPCLYWP